MSLQVLEIEKPKYLCNFTDNLASGNQMAATATQRSPDIVPSLLGHAATVLCPHTNWISGTVNTSAGWNLSCSPEIWPTVNHLQHLTLLYCAQTPSSRNVSCSLEFRTPLTAHRRINGRPTLGRRWMELCCWCGVG